jgi:predicted DNA-binding transcriptional regulator AlpA
LPTELLKLKDVLARVPYSRSQLYEMIKLGRLPGQVHLGGRGSFWIEDEIEQWLRERIAAERNQRSSAEKAA